MSNLWTPARLRDHLRKSTDTADDLRARDRLMPRDAEGRSTRPIDAPLSAEPRMGAVLALLYPFRNDIYLPLTVRPASMRHHSGEVSLPGGGFEASDATLEHTALREANEELGIDVSHIEIVTSLSPIWIPVSNFRITPYVGLLHERPDFRVAPDEVAVLLETPLSLLVDPAIVQRETRELRGRLVTVPYFLVESHKVWGATALVLAQLIGRLTSQR